MMKKNKFLTLISALVIAAASLSFTSCEDILNIIFAPFGTLTGMDVVGLDGSAYVTWSNGAISSYTLTLNVVETVSGNKPSADYPRTMNQNDGYYIVEGLTNGTEYTFTLTLQNDENTTLSKRATPSADSVKTHGYDGSAAKSFVELESGDVAILIKNASGKRISYANVNTSTSKVISASSVRRYVSPSSSSSISPNVSPRSGDETEKSVLAPKIRHFVPPKDFDVKVIGGMARSGSYGDTFDPDNPAIGQTRHIYVDQDVNLETYKQEEMTLYAIGYEPSGGLDADAIACLVWARTQDVTNDENCRDGSVNVDVIKDICSKFVKYYKFEERIFGQTYNMLLNRNFQPVRAMKPYVNIVLWDIGKDGTSGNCGVVGYFWAKDYYQSSVQSNSNEGKYFYIDIPFCNYDSYGSYSGNGGTVSDTVISTLFHEYQHMINFNQKVIVAGHRNVDTWYNEMLSMLCEDLMGDALGLESGEKVYDGRIPNFNAYYYYSGAAQYLDSNSWVSYATAYNLGSFLMRNYGGTALVREMSINDSVGIASVVSAVNTKNGTSCSWNDIFKEYVKACAFRPGYAKSKGLPTHNITHIGDGWVESYPVGSARVDCATNRYASSAQNYNVSGGNLSTSVTGINLWKYGNSVSGSNYYGPISVKVNASIDLQPTGFIFHPIGTATSNDVLLLFTSPSSSDDKVWIFIQDDAATTARDTTAAAINDSNL